MNLLYLCVLLALVGDTPLDAYTTPGSFLFRFRLMPGQKSLAYELTKITANLALGEFRNAKENGNYYNGSYRDETTRIVTRRIHSFIPSSPKVSLSLSPSSSSSGYTPLSLFACLHCLPACCQST